MYFLSLRVGYMFGHFNYVFSHLGLSLTLQTMVAYICTEAQVNVSNLIQQWFWFFLVHVKLLGKYKHKTFVFYFIFLHSFLSKCTFST